MSSNGMWRVRAAACSIAVALLAGCGGGSTAFAPVPRSSAPVAGGTSTPGSVAQGKATFEITWPSGNATSSAARGRAGSARGRDYLAPTTKSISISVNGGTPIDIDNPNVANSGASPTPTTTQIVQAPIGTDTFTVNDYGQLASAGSVLATNSISFAIVQDSANVVPITLNGVLSKVACSAVAPFASGTAPAFTIVGPTGQIGVLPEDADSNIIVAPGYVPAVTLSADATMATVTAASAPNTFNVNPKVVGTAVTLNAAGTMQNGTTVSSTCTATRVLAMYVTNHYYINPGQSASGASTANASVTIYPASATGAATPTATIQGSNTTLADVQFIAVDTSGNIFTTNVGPQPGATFGPTSGSVAIFGAGTYGNVAPVGTIANLNTPEGITFDSTGKLYVLSIDRITEYPANQNGLTASAVPSNTIAGSNFDVGCYGLAVDATFALYSACPYEMQAFAPGATGNAKPSVIQAIGNTSMSYNDDSWIGVAVDASNNLILPAANDNLDDVDIYPTSDVPAPGSAATPVPTTSKSTGYNEPYGVAFDSTGKYYVLNYGSNSLETFTSLTTFETGLGTNSALAGLNEPIGIAIR